MMLYTASSADGSHFSGLLDFLKTQGIALVALLQVWIIWLYRKFAISGRIEDFPGDLLELGYSEFGPTLSMSGTLKAFNRDVFVKRIKLKVRKLRNNEEHTFEWVAFRPLKVSLAGSPIQEFEIPSSFIVTAQQPHRYVILFSDQETQGRMRPHLESCQQEWERLFWDGVTEGTVDITSTPIDVSSVRTGYLRSSLYAEASDVLNRLFYWEAGEYELVLTIDSDGRAYSHRSRFSVRDQDFLSVRLNVQTMVHAPERRYTSLSPTYYFAYPTWNKG